MAKLIMEVGKVYGGVKVIEMTPGFDLITVQCLRCGEHVKKNRSNVRSRKIMSCGRFSCKEKSKWWRQLHAKESM